MVNGSRRTMMFECDMRAAHRARRFVSEALQEWGMEPLTPNAELLVSELVSNAVKFSNCVWFKVEVGADAERVVIGVWDPAPELVPQTDAERPDGPRFGLRLIDTLAERWGVEPAPPGKWVWLTLNQGEAFAAA